MREDVPRWEMEGIPGEEGALSKKKLGKKKKKASSFV